MARIAIRMTAFSDLAGGIPRRGLQLLWTGQGVSMLGSEVTKLVVPLIALRDFHATTLQIGLIRFASTAPVLVLTFLVGALVDRLRRRRLLIGTNLVQAALVGTLVVLSGTHYLRITTLIFAAFVLGVAAVFFTVAWPTFVPTVVPRDDLTRANSRLFGAQSVAEAAGPGLAGLMMAQAGATWALLLDSLSFVVSAATLLTLRAGDASPVGSVTRLFRDIVTGVRATLGHPLLRTTIVSIGISNFFDSAANTIFLVYAVRVLGLDPRLLGLVLGCGSIGAIIGSLLSARLVERFGLGVTISRVAVITPVVACALLIPRSASPWSAAILIPAFGGWTMGDAIYSVQAVSIRQAATADQMRGRVSATGWFFVLGGIPVGALAGGLLGEAAGLWVALAISLAGMLPARLMLLRPQVSRLTSLPAADEAYWRRYA
jgi:MFS family permease